MTDLFAANPILMGALLYAACILFGLITVTIDDLIRHD